MTRSRRDALCCVAVLALALAGCGVGNASSEATSTSGIVSSSEDVSSSDTSFSVVTEDDSHSGILQSSDDIALTWVEGDGYSSYYVFTYDGEQFWVYWEPDCWKVYDSYKITNENDITLICEALLREHEVHGADLVSMRTSEDMAYEWAQHNLAYAYLPEDSEWRESARNVDLDPDDQGKSLQQIFDERVGSE